MIDGRKMKRRAFLRAAGTGLALPWLVPASVRGANPPSQRVNVAVIGAGNQSRADVPSMLKLDDVQVVALCDVNRASHGYARPEHFLGREPVQALINEFYAKKTGAGP